MPSPSSRTASKSGEIYGWWYPGDLKFRNQFNNELAAAISKIGIHRDTGPLRRLLDSIEDDPQRKSLTLRIIRVLPIEYDLQTGNLKLKKGAEFNWEECPIFDAFEPPLYFTSNSVKKRPRNWREVLASAQQVKRQANYYEKAGRVADAKRKYTQAKRLEIEADYLKRVEDFLDRIS